MSNNSKNHRVKKAERSAKHSGSAATPGRDSFRLRLEGISRAKVKDYFQSQLRNAISQADDQIPKYLESLKSFAELGRYIYGFRWASTSFRDEGENYGSPQNRSDLLRQSLTAAMQIIRDHVMEEKRQDEGGFVALTAFLHLLAEIMSLITTVFLFLENKTWEAWTFVGVTLASRVFQLGTVAFLQRGTCRNYVAAVSGISLVTDAYRMMSPKDDYDAPIGELDFGVVAAIRKGGAGILQFVPQLVLNIYMIVTTLEEKQQFGGLLWIQLISIASIVLAFGISLTKFNIDYIIERAKNRIYEVLFGDEDAHYAGLVKCYLTSDLPWDKLSAWLLSKKHDFLLDPPMWLSEDWLSLIPENIRATVWDADDFMDLKDAIHQVEEKFRSILLSSGKKTAPIRPHQTHFNRHRIAPMEPQPNTETSIRIVPSEQIENAESLNNGPTDDPSLRCKVIQQLKRRRSSIVQSLKDFIPQHTLHRDMPLKDLRVPLALQSLLKKAEVLSRSDIMETAYSVLEEEFAKVIIDTNEPETHDDFPALVLGALLKYLRKKTTEKEKDVSVARTVVAAFFEAGDEVSDIVLAILFAMDSADLWWAAVLMFVFMGLNRAMNAFNSFVLGEPFLRICEALLGVKGITDSYRIVTQGSHLNSGKVDIITSRAYCLAIGLACESLPQMMLQLSIVLGKMKNKEMNQGILAAQITSVLASCLSIGLSFASISLDGADDQRMKHPIIFLANIDENLIPFLFSTVNWKETLRDELWNNPAHASYAWGIPELIGDHDALHGRHIQNYKVTDLPWKKIERWLRSKKASFLEKPPLWMTPGWFDNLTPEVKKAVWNEPGELDELVAKVKEFCRRAVEENG
eukprot:g1494.t1